jgi:hypothetical protein
MPIKVILADDSQLMRACDTKNFGTITLYNIVGEAQNFAKTFRWSVISPWPRM